MAPDEQTRRQLAAELGDLAARTGSALRPAYELLASAAAADPPKYPAATLVEVAGLLRQTEQRLRDNQSTATLAETAEAVARYAQPNWQVEKVFNFLVSTGQPAEPPAPEPRRLPVVLAVMTRPEAADLLTGEAFAGYSTSLNEAFGQLRQVLAAAVVDDWPDRYGDERQLWRPFGEQGGTLAELVDATLNRLNDRHRYSPPLVADYLSVTRLQRDRWELRRLRRDGCILIVDAISMRHPVLQRALHTSLLDAYPNTSVMVVAPVRSALEARELAVVLELRLADLEFNQRRIDPDEDWGASVETAERQTLEQWLATRVRIMAGAQGVKSGIRSYMTFGPGGDS